MCTEEWRCEWDILSGGGDESQQRPSLRIVAVEDLWGTLMSATSRCVMGYGIEWRNTW